jgi:hypothetical protein
MEPINQSFLLCPFGCCRCGAETKAEEGEEGREEKVEPEEVEEEEMEAEELGGTNDKNFLGMESESVEEEEDDEDEDVECLKSSERSEL